MFDFELWKERLVEIPTELLTDAWQAVREHQKQREAQDAVNSQVVQVIRSLRESGAIASPVEYADTVEGYTPWQDAGGDQTRMPLQGDRYQYGGRVYESLKDFNAREPGADTWVDVTGELHKITGV